MQCSMPFYRGYLTIHGLWYPWGVLEPISLGYQGTIACSELCDHHHNFRIFSSPRTETCTPQASAPFLPALTPTKLLFLFRDLPLMAVSYKWNYTTCCPLCLASVTQHRVFRGQPHWSVCQCCVSSVAAQQFRVCVYHTLLIHLSTGRICTFLSL